MTEYAGEIVCFFSPLWCVLGVAFRPKNTKDASTMAFACVLCIVAASKAAVEDFDSITLSRAAYIRYR